MIPVLFPTATIIHLSIVLLLPPFIIDGLRAMHCVPAGKWGNIITQLGRKMGINETHC